MRSGLIRSTQPSTSFAFVFLALLSSLFLFSRIKADADFESVRVRFDYADRSGRKGDPSAKYWHESVFHPHYDGRFTDRTLPYDQQRSNLTVLVQSYLSSMEDLGAETWLCHGTLLGWWWNRQILPWDSDIDVQMTAHSIGLLARYYNMTVHDYRGKKYMLEINPAWSNGSYADRLNKIDGRWIDIYTGLFIDITAARPKPGSSGAIVATKDRHEQITRDVFPLRRSEFEGMHVNIPNNYLKILSEEYGRKAVTKLKHMGHRFNTSTHEWERTHPEFTKITDCLGSARHCEAVTAQQKADAMAAAEQAQKKPSQKGTDDFEKQPYEFNRIYPAEAP